MLRFLFAVVAALVLLLAVSLLLAKIPSPAPGITSGEPARGVRFELFDGQARVPWSARLGRASFTPRDGLGGPVGGERGTVGFNEPGSYTLRPEGMRDFEDVIDLPYEVPEEGWNDVRVPLRRRK